ncbi:apoptosis-associated speck-like protein containing a CARD [Brienomyrus brachyistius]|uniref:apoptosis-associated speck-like protein containing a CARD n=1 Tax=Brienomyrus brachyistius TaxID=42636 RepID=UPI0020B3ACF8|nr:apoptosis-associated speck-like protein containing a CARD [Brienomyrus brachyistius]
MERTVLDCVVEALDNLSADDFTRFKRKLCETKKIRYGQIENANKIDVAQKIVSVFTKAAAVSRTADVLRAIGLNEDAEALEEEGTEVSKVGKDSSGDTRGKGGTSRNIVNEQHFVDRKMSDLINRVSPVAPILDQLFQSGFIKHEMYSSIYNERNSCDQMRSLMLKVIMPGGNRAKDELCKILENQQKYLMEDLKGQ